MNASTIRGYKLSLKDQVKAVAAAGYGGFEPWLKDIHAARADGTFADVVKIARDTGLEFVNGIAFGQWVHPDAKVPSARAAWMSFSHGSKPPYPAAATALT